MLTVNGKQEGSEKKYRLKPYWGNPAVRNFRGSGGNLGIIEVQLAPLLYSTFPWRMRSYRFTVATHPLTRINKMKIHNAAKPQPKRV